MKRYGRRRKHRFWPKLVLAVLLLTTAALCWAAIRQGTAPMDGLPGRTSPAGSRGIFSFLLPREDLPCLDVPYIDQRALWPTGCESVSATMLLNYFGGEIDPDTFIDNYLPMAPAPYYDENGILMGWDPRQRFLGDPRSESGWGCFAPAIVKALEAARADGVLGDPESYAVVMREDATLETLCADYIDRELPVLVWATIGMEEPVLNCEIYMQDAGEYFPWYTPMHCMVLVGEDEEYFYFNDPLVGKNTAYEKSLAEARFEAQGMQAVALEPAAF